MGTFATYSEQEGDRRTSIRVQDDGTVMLLVAGLHGEVIESSDRTIDRDRAARIVGAVAAGVPDLVDLGGPCTVGFGRGEGQPATWSFPREHASSSMRSAIARMKNLADELRTYRDYAPPPLTSERGGRRSSAELTPAAFVGWVGAYFVGHLLSAGLGVLLLFVGMRTLQSASTGTGLLALAGGVGAMLLLIASTFFFIGRAQGRRYGDVSAVWQCALAAVVAPAIVAFFLGGGFSLSGIGLFLPLIAKAGAYSAARRDSSTYG